MENYFLIAIFAEYFFKSPTIFSTQKDLITQVDNFCNIIVNETTGELQ